MPVSDSGSSSLATRCSGSGRGIVPQHIAAQQPLMAQQLGSAAAGVSIDRRSQGGSLAAEGNQQLAGHC